VTTKPTARSPAASSSSPTTRSRDGGKVIVEATSASAPARLSDCQVLLDQDRKLRLEERHPRPPGQFVFTPSSALWPSGLQRIAALALAL